MSKIDTMSSKEIIDYLNQIDTPTIFKKDYNRINDAFLELMKHIESNTDSHKYANVIKIYTNRILLNQLYNVNIDETLEEIIYKLTKNCSDYLPRFYLSDLFDAIYASENKMMNCFNKDKSSNYSYYANYLFWRNDFLKLIEYLNIKDTMLKFELDSLNKLEEYSFSIKFFTILLNKINAGEIDISIEDIYAMENFTTNNNWFIELINKKNLTKEEGTLIKLYISTIIKPLAQIDEIKTGQSPLVVKLFNGTLVDKQVIESLIKAISNSSLLSQIKKGEKDVYYALFYHLKYELGVNDKIIEYYMAAYFKKFSEPLYFSTFFINHLVLLNNTQIEEKFPFLNTIEFKRITTKGIKSIRNGNEVILNTDFVIHYINNYTDIAGTRKFEQNNFGANLIEAITTTNYYTIDEIKKIKEALNKHGYLKLFCSKRPNYDEKDIFFNQVKKAETSFYRKECMPNDVAIDMIKKQIDGKMKLTSTAMKTIIKTIITNCLKKYGNYQIFFYNNSESFGSHQYDNEHQAVYIDESLIDDFLVYFKSDEKNKNILNGIKLFEVMFHEITHCKQLNTYNYGIINYESYEELKDLLNKEQYPDYYNNNYRQISIEVNARINSYRMLIKFFEIINPLIALKIQENLINKEREETKLLENESRKSPLNPKLKINRDKLFDILIMSNPHILRQFPIFYLEYDLKGKKRTLIETFYFVKDNFEYYDLLVEKIMRIKDYIKEMEDVDFENYELNDLRNYLTKKERGMKIK